MITRLLLFFLFITSVSFLKAQNTGDFRSAQSGNWSDASTWETFNGATWNPASSSPTSADGVISILSGNEVTIISTISVDQITILDGGILTVANGGVLNLANGSGIDIIASLGSTLNINGTITLQAGFGSSTMSLNGDVFYTGTINNASSTRVSVNDGASFYYDKNGDNIPLANWSSNSNLILRGIVSAFPNNLNQTFGNLTIESGSINSGFGFIMAGFTSVTVIAGDFSLLNTNGEAVILTETSSTINIDGDFNVSGNSGFGIKGGVGTTTLNVGGDVNLNGTIDNYLSDTGIGDINISGDLNISSGGLYGLEVGSGGTISFVNSGTHIYNVSTNAFGIGEGPSINIASGEILEFSPNSYFNGSGDFTIQSAGTAVFNSFYPNGEIQNSTTNGTIRNSGARVYSLNSTFSFSALAEQKFGNGFPNTGDVNVIINNPSGVVMNSDILIGINRVLAFEEGELSIGANTLTLNGVTTVSNGSLAGSASSNLVIGGTGSFGVIPFTGSTNILNDLTINRTSSGSVNLLGNLTILGTLDQEAGIFDIDDASLVVNGDFTRNTGDFNSNNNSNLTISGAGSLPAVVSFGTNQQLNKLQMQRDGSSLVTNSAIAIDSLMLIAGIVDNAQGTFAITDNGLIERRDGSITATPNFLGVYDLVYSNSAAAIISGPELTTSAIELNNFTKTGGERITVDQTFSVNGDMSITNGILDIGTNYARLRGDLTVVAGTDFIDGVFEFIGGINDTSTVSGLSVINFGELIVTSAVLVPSSSTDINIVGDFTVNNLIDVAGTTSFSGTTVMSGSGEAALNFVVINSGATLSAIPGADGGELQIARDFTNNGTFDPLDGVVRFNGTTSFMGSNTPGFHDVIIDGTLQAPNLLNVTGDFTNNGTFNPGTGTVRFNGLNNAQYVIANNTIPFYDIEVNGNTTAGVTDLFFESGISELRNRLTLLSINDRVDADGSGGAGELVLISSATYESEVSELLTGASIVGNVTVQRYIPGNGGTDYYHYITGFVNNAAVSQLQDDYDVTGSFTGAGSTTNNPSLFYYDESVTGDKQQGYIAYPTAANSEILTKGVGYASFVYGNSSDIIADLRGVLHNGDISPALSFTNTGDSEADGWNLIGNPFPATLDWESISSDASFSGVAETVYLWDPGAGQYVTYTTGGMGTNGGSKDIAKGQGFWVYTDGNNSPNITLRESHKSTTSGDFQRYTQPEGLLRIVLSDGTKSDETLLDINPDASTEFEGDKDAWKLSNRIFNISSITPEGKYLAVNSTSGPGCDGSIQLAIWNIKKGNYTINFDGVTDFAPNASPVLIDNYTGEETQLQEGMTYQFEINDDEQSKNYLRFAIRLESNGLNSNLNYTLSSSCNDSNALVSFDSDANIVYGLFAGDSVYSEQEGTGNELIFEIAGNDLEAGSSSTFVIKGRRAGCDQWTQIEVLDIENNQLSPEILNDGRYLVSNYEEGNQWFFNGELLEGETGQYLEFNESGQYKLEVSVNGCTSFVEDVFVITGIDDNFNIEYSLYPVPTDNELNIRITDKESYNNVNASIITIDGRILMEISLELSSGVWQSKLDVTELEPGSYIINLDLGSRSVPLRFIKY
ncbi:T9SS type A sorting domain-containing protein [Marinigracilibium pacificum]|uniref:Secretion system C-terminal sorting domain-containing protein n=1 Tax=Marinigracilibium pacificum TaxID=2729599 RepID=A0A848J154_9BACT|nr:T9SS type A sorting domain-containing protein [Marinigracilibium pacificum]NMM48029.1 hypothetical protein [Marinigracilibium pacificum]